jgi:hypothetical protein
MRNTESELLERREDRRFLFSLPQPATIVCEGETHGAEMIDISLTGAKFRCTGQDKKSLPQRDGEAVCTIRLPSGTTWSINGSIRWTIRYPEGVTLGVRFAENAEEKLAEIMGNKGIISAG